MLVQAITTHDVIELLAGLEKTDMQYATWCMTQDGMKEEGRLEVWKFKKSIERILAFTDYIDRHDLDMRIAVNNLRRVLLKAHASVGTHELTVFYHEVKMFFHELLCQLAPTVSMLAFEVL